MAFEQGGGGGRAPGLSPNNNHALSKPYDLSGEMTPSKMDQLNEMLELLFRSAQFSAGDITTLSESSGSGGDVVGPSSAVDGRIALFDGTTGKLLEDGGKLGADLVTGPASASSDGNVVLFNGVTGKIIKDSGSTLASLTGTLPVHTKVSLTEVPLEGASTTPITLVAAQGANTVIVPYHFFMFLDTTVAYSNNPNWTLQYAARNTNLTTANAMGTTGINAVTMWMSAVSWNPLATSVFDPRNKALVLKASADLTGAGSTSGFIIVAYTVLQNATP